MKKISTILVLAAFSLQSNAQANLSDGLVAYYPFNGTFADTVKAVNLSSVQGSVSFGEDKNLKANSALLLSGLQTKLSAVNSIDFGTTQTASISAWVKTSEISLKYFVLTGNISLWTMGSSLGVAVEATGGTNSASGSITSGDWAHIVGTYDGTTIKCYINGVKTGETAHPGGGFGQVNVAVGVSSDGSYWAGSVDDLLFYNRVLTSDEIAALANKSTPLITGLTESEVKEVDFQISPNPVQSFVQFSSQVSDLKIKNMMGQIVFEKAIVTKDEKVNIQLPQGNYFAQITENGKVKVQQMIVQ